MEELMHSPARGSIVLFACCFSLALACSVGGCARSDDHLASSQQRVSALAANYDWLQFYGDVRRTGNNTLESRITAANVGGLKQLFRVTLPATGDGAPAILTAAQTTSSGIRDIAFVTTKAGHILALDAHTGATIWQTQPAVASQITSSSAAVDPSRAYVYSYGVDGYVHKFDVASGSELKTTGFPQLVTLKPNIEKGSSAIATATANGTSYLYMATSAFIGDGGTYQGHLTTINLNTGAQKVFNAACSNRAVHFSNGGAGDCAIIQSALWARVGIVYDSGSNRILAGTGNGTYNPATFTWGDSLLALNPDGSGNANGTPLDSYTPTNYQTLQNADLDLGSTAPALLYNSGTKYPHIALQSGKDAMLRIINLDNMSGQNGPGHVAGELFSMALPQGGEVQNAVPTWVNPADNSTWAFVASPKNGLAAFKLIIDGSGNPSLQTMWQLAVGGGSPLIANNVLYYSTTNKVYALSPTAGTVLWSDATIGKIHWESPVVANGVLYVLDESAQLTAYSLDGSSALPRGGWTASASLSANGSPPPNAIDADTTTRWTTGITQAAGQWFQLDLGATQTFNQVTVLAGGNGDYAAGYQLLVSDNGTSWSSPIAAGAATSQTWSILFPATSARYLRIVLTATSTSWWSVGDLNVYNSPSGTGVSVPPDMSAPAVDLSVAHDLATTPPDLAGTTADMSSPPPASGPLSRTGWTAAALPAASSSTAGNALDGDTTTRWTTGAAQASGQQLVIDMQQPQTFAEVILDAAGSANDYPRGYQLYVSTDGNTWGTSVASGSGKAALVTIRFATQTARYLKIVQTGTGSSWWSVAELNVYPQASLDPSSWVLQASPSSTTDVVANAVDGNLATRWTAGVAQANGQTFTVDLGAAKTFSRLVLDDGNSAGDYPRGYQVFVSNDGSTWGSAVASGAGSTNVVTISFAPQNARYFQIVQTGSAPNWWSIAELTAY
jgi:hypothetical protein